jgi:hypothetical protein
LVYSSITNKNYVTGGRYQIHNNSFLNVGGQGALYLPGTVAGVLGSGGEMA